MHKISSEKEKKKGKTGDVVEMSGAREKTRILKDQGDGTKNRVPQRSSDSTSGKKAPTPAVKQSQPGTSRVAQPSTSPLSANETTKEKLKKKMKTKGSRTELHRTGSRERIEKHDQAQEEDPAWFQGEEDEEDKEERVWTTKHKIAKDNWDETTEHEEDSEGEEEQSGGTKTNLQDEETTNQGTKTNNHENEAGKKPEEASILTRIAKADKAMMKALFKIASIVGENRDVQQEVDNILTAHSKLKTIVMEQSDEIAFQRGRIAELERTPVQTRASPQAQEMEEDGAKHQQIQQRPTYALVVSSGTLEKQQVARLIKQQVDLTRLNIQDATLRPGREGVVITTSSKEAVGKLEAQIQRKTALQHLQVRKPNEYLYNIKIIGIDEETDMDTLPETLVKQNHLTCDPNDLKVTKTWKGRQGATVVLALNRKGANALKEKRHVNIGWDRCPVYDHFFIPRCVRCGEHGHTVNGCSGPARCLNCGREGHRREECANTARCRACERDGRANKEHSTMAWNCPTYSEKLEAEKRRILARLN